MNTWLENVWIKKWVWDLLQKKRKYGLKSHFEKNILFSLNKLAKKSKLRMDSSKPSKVLFF